MSFFFQTLNIRYQQNSCTLAGPRKQVNKIIYSFFKEKYTRVRASPYSPDKPAYLPGEQAPGFCRSSPEAQPGVPHVAGRDAGPQTSHVLSHVASNKQKHFITIGETAS